jgi:hypothetical protein
VSTSTRQYDDDGVDGMDVLRLFLNSIASQTFTQAHLKTCSKRLRQCRLVKWLLLDIKSITVVLKVSLWFGFRHSNFCFDL